MTFTVLVACSANICRSPLAAALLERAVALEAVGRVIAVESGGVDVPAGQRACPDTIRMTESHGIHGSALPQHLSRPLSTEQIATADLVLTSDRRIRSAVLKREPGVAARTFTLREAALLGEDAANHVEGRWLEDRLRSYVAAMNAHRGLTDLPRTRHVLAAPWRRLAVHAHDIPDAHQGEQASHRVVFQLIASSTERVARGLVSSALVRTR